MSAPRLDTKPPATLLYLSRTGISEMGFGGKRRAYQIKHDLETMPGGCAVVSLSVPDWAESRPGASRVPVGLSRKARSFFRLLSPRPRRAFDVFVPGLFWRDYEALVRSLERPVVGIIDDARLAYGQVVNERYGIPTVYCCHNLQSLHLFNRRQAGVLGGMALGLEVSKELSAFERARGVLLISRVEVSVLQGFGMRPLLYSYRPVGKVRERLLQIRQARTAGSDQGHFLLMGNAVQRSTQESMAWFLRNVAEHGLPEGISIVGVGKNLEAQWKGCSLPPSMVCRDWVDPEAFESLMIGARAVLVPHFGGFGALTRLPEIACAGVPVLTTSSAISTMDLLPGVRLAGHDWESWLTGMRRLQGDAPSMPISEYLAWEGRQPDTLRALLGEMLTERADRGESRP